MLRRNLLPSSFGRFSSVSACFTLPLLQQNFSFASTKSKAVVMKTQKKRGMTQKIDFDQLDFSTCLSNAQKTFKDTYSVLLANQERAKKAWRFSKKLARADCASNHPHFTLQAIAAFISLPYGASSKRRDFSLIRLLFPHEIALLDQVQLTYALMALERANFEEAPMNVEVAPLSVPQMKKLIGTTKISSPLDRAIFQCFVLGCKVSDLHRQQRVFLPKYNLVLIRQQRANSSFSFIRYVPSTKEQFERVWTKSELKTSKKLFFQNLNNHIKNKLKSSAFTPSNIPEGAIKFLRDSGVPDKEITSVNGDGPVHTSLYARSSASPQKTAPRQQTRNITKLMKAIFPDGKY